MNKVILVIYFEDEKFYINAKYDYGSDTFMAINYVEYCQQLLISSLKL